MVANRRRAFNQGLSMEEVDREFMVPVKFYIKNVLKGEIKQMVHDDKDVYKDKVNLNERLLIKSEDHFAEH